MTDRQILYFADPMCSWCWGFSPVIHQIAKAYADTTPIQIHLGGLRAGNNQVMDNEQRMYILNHWFSVNEASGQPFDFSFNMPEGFIYDTEPACRAVKTMQAINPAQDLDYFKSIQNAFYTENKDVTQTQMLATLAAGHDVDVDEFTRLFETEDLKQQTQNDIILSGRMGVNGFPTLIGKSANEYVYLTQGFQLFEQVDKTISHWLN